jgi:soluble lytic murein transglycosylase-like protein
MNGICRWRIDRAVARIALAGLVNVLALVFAAGWLVGAHIPEPAAEEAAPVVAEAAAAPAIAERPPIEEPPPPPQPDPVRRPRRPLILPASWRAPVWHAPARARTAYSLLIRDAAVRHSLSPSLVEAVARVESGFNSAAVSSEGARGLLQVLPETARRFGVEAGQLFDPEQNLAAGTAYLAWLLDRYRGDLDLALAAYNAGEGAVDDHGGVPPYPETQAYVRRVKAALVGIAPSADEQDVFGEPSTAVLNERREDVWQPFRFPEGPPYAGVPPEKTGKDSAAAAPNDTPKPASAIPRSATPAAEEAHDGGLRR